MLRLNGKPKFISITAVLALNLCCWEAASGWDNKPRENDASVVELPVAFETNARGDLSEVYVDSDDKVSLRVSLASGFIQFAADNCPTIQIDKRTPVHHQPAGDNCQVSPQAVTVNLGDIVDKLIVSLPLHRLMNGSELAVRFVTASGEYREATFALRNSKTAIQSALGSDVEVRPSLDET